VSLELRQMRHLLAVAEHGSFGRAAAALRISQPALSRSIQSIEELVGAELFLRSASGIESTDFGRLLVQRARQVVQIAEELDREVLSHQSLHADQVCVGGGPYPVESILSAAVARFIGRYPRAQVRLQAGNWDELLRRLRSREIDFFVSEVSTLQEEHGLAIEPLAEHPLYFAARKGHPLAGRRDVTAADTFAFPFASPSRIPPRLLEPMLKAERELLDPVNVARVFPSVECNALSAVKRIVADSDAITAFMLTSIEEELEEGRFVLLGSESWLSVRYGVISLAGQSTTVAAEKLRELVLDAERALSLEEERLAARWKLGASPSPSAPRP
jgi:DNA-binding transcriptional LysR family regulator